MEAECTRIRTKRLLSLRKDRPKYLVRKATVPFFNPRGTELMYALATGHVRACQELPVVFVVLEIFL